MFRYTLDFKLSAGNSIHSFYDTQEDARKEAQNMFAFYSLNGRAIESITLKMFRSYFVDGIQRHAHTDQINAEDLLSEFTGDDILAKRCIPILGMGATEMCYSDKHSYTIIAMTKCTITVQRDKAERAETFKPEWIPGGFSAICTNQSEQKWNIQPDPNGMKATLRPNKGRGWFHNGTLFVLGRRDEFYDYNF